MSHSRDRYNLEILVSRWFYVFKEDVNIEIMNSAGVVWK